jgi:hypothetical protein
VTRPPRRHLRRIVTSSNRLGSRWLPRLSHSGPLRSPSDIAVNQLNRNQASMNPITEPITRPAIKAIPEHVSVRRQLLRYL